jgi:hypothetical protein
MQKVSLGLHTTGSSRARSDARKSKSLEEGVSINQSTNQPINQSAAATKKAVAKKKESAAEIDSRISGFFLKKHIELFGV